MIVQPFEQGVCSPVSEDATIHFRLLNDGTWIWEIVQRRKALLMRVIAGKAKGRKLMMVPGDSTRPITDSRQGSALQHHGHVDRRHARARLFGGTGGSASRA